MYELDRELKKILNDSPKPIYALDLHTTSGPGPAFANLDDTLPNRRFALEFPAPIVMGLEEELAGTLTSYLSYNGAVTLGFESGQHYEMPAIERAEAAAWIALEAAGLLPRGKREEVQGARKRLKADMGKLPQVVEVVYRHAVTPYDKFRMEPGWKSFDKVDEGRVLGRDRRGPVMAPRSGRILMPLYQPQGADGFFVIRRIHPVWLKVSEWVRRGHAERVLHYLPGVREWDEQPGRFLVDLRVARWYALELFHLLGFQRQQQTQNQLIMSRRTRL